MVFSHRIDRLGVALTVLSAAAILWMPLVVHKANRIAAGQSRSLAWFLDSGPGWVLLAVLALTAGAATLKVAPRFRFAAASLLILTLPLTLGLIATQLVQGSPAARVSIGGSFWVLLTLAVLLMADALVRVKLTIARRLMVFGGFAAGFALFLASGWLNDLSVMREFAGRSDQFWREAAQHIRLSLGSLAIALVLGLPLGVFCAVVPRVRAAVLQTLSLIQTIPSIALFGLLMLPLTYLATHVPLAAELGIRGIGATPALIALVLYALLPVVANTVIGLEGVPPAVRDAAFGMGLSPTQVLVKVDMPLALPVILTGIRIVLVQSIGMVTIAGLIGGGGFGAFVFQGINQTATDLVLLGAIPTVVLAFTAAVLLDAVVDATRSAAP
jgi:osmoprotectant transport system permease protein